MFIDKGTGQRYYCKSAFERTTIDYLENQAVLTVLKKEKVMNGIRHYCICIRIIWKTQKRKTRASVWCLGFVFVYFKRRITCKYIFLASAEKFF